ncbi:hypothetical protein AA23498_1350 [Acetobacter nitrogenifigens DSM 23921 = NBRC 105050]|uniref:Uncharacterized protein n=1 Tax=Acetobacter nitrogenifigens DSM 23921 = NBRC 105050 TaxID=1120919 RepID=A0A511X5B7_9PROT|nr:hypothetical protein [Acetobacter nitrogenifigens]GBQ92050.1 hypothetical protein AA23498_1350 [Acetobacter nitrogenifigens DSM 23921 = NBRC 105050]GEN58142.1 hypothetical protein ANI02nite_00260 [Acetobacter nitrogenifigens DSM 23921 = NBRC 105050]
MIRRAHEYIRTILRREHWWAEAWSGIALIAFGMASMLQTREALHATPSTHNFFILLPNGLWQSLLVLSGSYQLAVLVAGFRNWRVWRGSAAANAAFWSLWIAFSQVIYAFGYNPIVTFVFAWVGINLYALSRAIGGLR